MFARWFVKSLFNHLFFFSLVLFWLNVFYKKKCEIIRLKFDVVEFDFIVILVLSTLPQRYFAVLVLVVVAFGLVEADDSCPPNSKGKHPKCICNNDKPYDELNRICAITIEFKEVCPIGSEGVYPHCVCTEGKVYDAFRDACVNVDRSKCPQGSSNVNGKCICENVGDYKYEMDEIFWICRPWYIPTTSTTTSTTTIRPTYTTPQPRCPYHQSGEYPNCVWDPCPRGYFGGNIFSFVWLVFEWIWTKKFATKWKWKTWLMFAKVVILISSYLYSAQYYLIKDLASCIFYIF